MKGDTVKVNEVRKLIVAGIDQFLATGGRLQRMDWGVDVDGACNTITPIGEYACALGACVRVNVAASQQYQSLSAAVQAITGLGADEIDAFTAGFDGQNPATLTRQSREWYDLGSEVAAKYKVPIRIGGE